MKLVERAVDFADIGNISHEQSQPRTAGTHVSSIINAIAVNIGRRDNDFSRADLDAFAVLGRIFEHVLAQTILRPPRYVRPGELECDGIIGSPDAVDTEDPAVVEIKVTWKSSLRCIEDFREYWWQIKSYCWMLGVTRARLYVLYVCGDWRPPVPQWRCWEVTFTDLELRENWMMMVNNMPKESV